MLIFLDTAVAVALHVGQITAMSLAPPRPAVNAFDYAYAAVPFDTTNALPTDGLLLKAKPFRLKPK
jgi:hypothetical protein